MKSNFLSIFFVILITLFVLSSCKKEDIKDEPKAAFQSHNISYTEIAKAELSGSGLENISTYNMLITNDEDWQNLMNQMNTVNDVTVTFSETDINFDTYSIIVLFTDVKPSGWAVQISEITEKESNITVSYFETEFNTCAMSQPFHIVKIPKVNKPVVFEPIENLAYVSVLYRGVDCGDTYLIQFNACTPDNLPYSGENNIFYAINLPEEYKVDSTEIRVQYRLPAESEMMTCTTMGIAYPQIYIEQVIED